MLFWSTLTFKFICYIYTSSDTTITGCEEYPNCFSIDCPLNSTLFNRTLGNCACSSIVLLNNKIDEVYTCEYKEPIFNPLFLILIILYCSILLTILFLVYYLIKFTCDVIIDNRRLKYLSNQIKSFKGNL